jgi:hypothetical protein
MIRSGLLVAVACVFSATSSALPQSDSKPLPFDTVGAGRGTPPNRFESSRNVRWLGSDSLVTAYARVNDWQQPGTIELRAFAHDTTAGRLNQRRLSLGECPFELRLYATPGREGPAVWSSERAPRAVACPAYSEQRLGDVSVNFSVRTILGDSLPAQRYYLRYAVRLGDGRRLEYTDGEAYLSHTPAPVTRDRSALRFTSGSEISGMAPRMLSAWTAIKNTGTQAVSFEYGACALQIRLWRTPARSGKPVWISEARQPVQRKRPKNRIGYDCTMQLISSRLLPNDTLPFRLSVPLPEVLEDTLPEGKYWVGVELSLLDASLRPPGWERRYSFPVGELTLRRTPDFPPSVRQIGPLRIEAATRLTRGTTRDADSVRTFVLVTNVSDDSAEVVIVRGNPLTVYGFRSEEERDEYPIPTAAYTMPGSARYFVPHRFMLGGKKKWLFEHSVAAKDIVAQVGQGRLYFLAWLMGERSATLSAGDVELP